jgi:two-component system sensor histidine kinase KdpD
VADVLVKRLQSLLQAKAWLLVPAEGDRWIRLPESDEEPSCPPPSALLGALGPVARREDPLEPFFLDGHSYVALASTRGTEGMLQLHLAEGRSFPQEVWGSLQAFAVQGALALERVRWLEAAHAARVESETERMRSSLLSAISHDLRTPLAAIQGAASSMLLPAEPLPESTRRDLLSMIHDESEHLAQLLSNLLDLTRLESGTIQVRKEWQPLDEVIGAALRRVEARGCKGVRVMLPEDMPMVALDEVLAEQLLVNLIINAHRYAPETAVELRAWTETGSLQLAVADRGPGIPEAFRDRIFDKFFRMPGSNGDGGIGLGLAICDAIARAHGGRIWVEEHPGGGALFRVSIPWEGDPPQIEESLPFDEEDRS